MTHLASRGGHLLPGYKAMANLATKDAAWIVKHPLTATAALAAGGALYSAASAPTQTLNVATSMTPTYHG